MNKLYTAISIACLALATGVQAQGDDDSPRSPTPRLADGTVDLGGNGTWDLPYTTNFAATMEGYEDGVRPPFRPWAKAMW